MFPANAGMILVAVSMTGMMRNAQATEIWCAGMKEALKRLHPKTVLLYGAEMPEFDFGGAICGGRRPLMR